MRRFVKLLRGYVLREFLQALTWRGFLITLVINQAITPLLGLAIWSAALPGSSDVSTYYVALLAVQLMTVSYEHHTFSNGIYAGALSGDLLKPQPVVVTTLGANVALRIWHLLIGLPLIVATGVVVGVSFDVGHVLLAVPAAVLAAALRFLFTYSLALSAFWTQRAQGVVGFGETLIFLLGGVAAPITLFPARIRPLGEALPFRAMIGFPAELASGSLNATQVLVGYAWQVVWIGMFVLAAMLVWHAGVRRYTAVGG
ncbi:MAG TPA: ABC-2 family transporter protein [Herpetosiphonaceae bacterium]|nr:ABC-2 family transporter protein [Herpetosiphonaceae bacterium]